MSITEDRPETPGSRVTSKGQVTIPKAIREKLGVRPGDEVVFVEGKDGIQLRRRLRSEDLDKWVGYLKHLKGRTSDELVAEMRDG